MALLYTLLWRLLLLLLHVHRALLSGLRSRLRGLRTRLWERAAAALLLPGSLTGAAREPEPRAGQRGPAGRRSRCLLDGQSLEKLPVHIGLLVTEEEPSYADTARLVVWCLAVGISYVSVYDSSGVFRRNSGRLLEEMLRQQRDLLGGEGGEGAPLGVELLTNGNDLQLQHVLSCRHTVKVLSPSDGKQSIVQAAQKLCRSVENKERSSKDISVSMLDTLLRESKNIPDPDLVLKFGPVDSTLGFLPWHIRLTEIISLASHRDMSYEDVLDALQRFGACEQRLGR